MQYYYLLALQRGIILFSEGSYVIPWEFHVNSCHFSGHLKVIFYSLEVMISFFVNTRLTSRVTNQNDRKCLGNITKFEKKN